MPEREVNLSFQSDDEPPMYIRAVVETFEAPLFTKEPTATISLICYDPDFYRADSKQVLGYTTSGNEEFEVVYEGDIESGFFIYMDLHRELNDLWIHHYDLDGNPETIAFSLPVDAPLRAGDRLMISTIAGSKGATVTRDNVPFSMLYAISPYAKWITLHPGVNQFRVYTDGDPIPFWFAHFDKFGGL
jgi:hypothetical protein